MRRELVDALTEVIKHYLVTDLEANIALYYGEIDEKSIRSG